MITDFDDSCTWVFVIVDDIWKTIAPFHSRTVGSITYTLSYDSENHLTGVTSSDNSVTAAFVYDGNGNRVQSSITVSGTTTTTSYMGNYYEWTSTSSTLYYYAGSTRVAMRVNGTLYYLLSDQLGSESVTTNASGGLVSEQRYSAWGDVWYSNGTVLSSYQYTGQYNQNQIGLYYYNARWYDSSLGRFIQPDNIILNQGNPQSWDRYAYVRNNPVNRVDPSGHFDTCGASTGDERCAADNAWTEDMLRKQIANNYGVTMAEENGRTWKLNNLRNVYDGLFIADQKLNGKLNSMIGGTTFTITDHTGDGDYSGEVRGDGSGLVFKVGSSDTQLPLTNILHETGHLLDYRPATKGVFSGPLTADPDHPSNNPDWTTNGYVDSALLIHPLSNQPVQALPMGESYSTGEYWADAFENYVLDNIKTGSLDFTGEGQDMYDYVFGALNPYANP